MFEKKSWGLLPHQVGQGFIAHTNCIERNIVPLAESDAVIGNEVWPSFLFRC